MPLELFAAALPGIEAITAAEVQALGVAAPQVQPGGVAFRGESETLYRANLELRTASAVLLRIGAFRATTFDELRRRTARLDWERFLAPGAPIELRVTCRKSRLYHSGAVAERIDAAIAERLGAAPAAIAAGGDAAPDAQGIVVRIERDRCQISLDSSGEPLHRRGYRGAAGKAPLRETLAAALLLASGWDPHTPLVDPFCGSGTIAIEAALLARGLAPGRGRRFAFEAWNSFDAACWQRLRRAAEGNARPAAFAPIIASDRDSGAIAAARENAARAGVGADIEFAQRALSDLCAPPGPGCVATNPPHGQRLRSGRDLRDLYARLGQVLRARCPGWRVALLSPGARLHGASGLALERLARVNQGGLRLELLRGDVGAAGERR